MVRRYRGGARRRVVLAAVGIGVLVAGVSGLVVATRGRPSRDVTTVALHPEVSRPGHRRRAVVPLLRLPVPLPRRRVDVAILMYHRVGPLSPRGPAITNALTVPSAAFVVQMLWLRAHGFHAIGQRQLFDALELGSPLPARPVLITFDDGYRDILWNAAPVLARLHMPATAYVITARISGPDSSFLTWSELRRLEGRGFDIGSHTVHHLELPYLSRAQALFELVASRRALEKHLGHPVQWFSFPAGAENAALLPLVREAGYVLAVTTQPGELQSADHPFLLHRDEVVATTGVRGLAALLGRGR